MTATTSTPRIQHFLDAGNYSIQSANSVSKKPLIIRSARVDLLPGDEVLSTAVSETNPLIERNGKRFLIGASALEQDTVNQVVTVQDDKIDGELFTALMLSTFAPVQKQTSYEVDLFFSVPNPARIKREGQLTQRVDEFLSMGLTGTYKFTRNGKEMHVKVRAQKPIHEGLAPVLVARDSGLVKGTGWTLGIDVGGKTALAILVGDDGTVKQQETFSDGGCVAIANDLIPRLSKTLGFDVPLHAVMDALGTEEKAIYGIYPIDRALLNAVIDGWYRQLLNMVKTQFSRNLPRVTGILWTGGTVNLISDRIKPGGLMVVHPRPETANLDGLVKYFGAK